MKRYGYLFDKVVDYETLSLAIDEASHGKKQRRIVQKILANKEHYIMQIQHMLLSDNYHPYHIKERVVHESGKDRKITSSPFFPDQIIHWALMITIQPIFYRSMYQYCIATVKGRGGALGKKAVKKWLRNDFKNTKYCLKMDIKKFYRTIDHNVLKDKLKRRFKDKRLLELMYKIIDCYEEGLPLGLYTSQWFANFYLENLDHKIKQELNAKYYVRYMDDIVIFGCNKKKLHQMRKMISNHVINDKLFIKDNWQVFRTDSSPIDFLGYKFYRNHVSIRGRIFLRIRRKTTKISKKSKPSIHDARSLLSYWGWIKNTDSYQFYNNEIKNKFSVKNAKGVLKHARNVRKNGSG